MPLGDAARTLPIKAQLRHGIHKEAGDRVTVRLQERVES